MYVWLFLGLKSRFSERTFPILSKFTSLKHLLRVANLSPSKNSLDSSSEFFSFIKLHEHRNSIHFLECKLTITERVSFKLFFPQFTFKLKLFSKFSHDHSVNLTIPMTLWPQFSQLLTPISLFLEKSISLYFLSEKVNLLKE